MIHSTMETSPTKPKISNEGMIDRISSLPDDILHNILSHLFIFDVVQLSLLSKRWQYLWTTLPYLHFDLNPFYSQRIQLPCDSAMVDKFKDFINWVLISQTSVKLVRFILCCENIFHKVAISRWVHATTRRNVQELVLSFRLGELFELPYCLATCESLRVLKLCLFGNLLKLPNHLGFHQLRLLHLEDVELSDEHLTNPLFSKCRLLENLILGDCSLGTMTMLDIASTSLVYVTIRNNNIYAESYSNCVVKISCPNVKFFKYKAPRPKDMIMENLFSIEAVHIVFFEITCSCEENSILVYKMIKEVASTSVLKLYQDCIWGLYVATRKVRLSPFSFYKLKYLRVVVNFDEYFMQVMILLLKSTPNLEVLKLSFDENYGGSENWKLLDPGESIVCLECHLKSIQLTGFYDEENELELIRFFLKNARVLEKLTIVWADDAHTEETPEEVVRFPKASSHVVLTFLDGKPWSPKRRSHNWYDGY